MFKEIKTIKKLVIYLIIFWTFVITFFIFFDIYKSYIYARNEALSQAKVKTQDDINFRHWVASHGGVYVPIDKNTPPNPYLAHLKNRDVETFDGQHLTLMNPAYALRQLLSTSSSKYKDKITSNILLNPNNKPDEWEKKALKIVIKNEKPYYEFKNHDYLRYMVPFKVEKSCLKCHAFQGYRVGDIRGAISVTIDAKPIFRKYVLLDKSYILELILLWLVGNIFIFIWYKKLRKSILDKMEIYEEVIYGLVDLVEQRDTYTAGHSKRVAEYSVMIAKEMGYDKNTLDLLYRAGMLHDIGKIVTPDSILLKPGKLDKIEFELIKEHVTIGYEFLKKIEIYKDIAEIIKYHHERYDGKGYTEGLKGDEIPILSAILAVADAFDAMTTNRIYKGRKDINTALKEIKELAGEQFHPKVAEAAQKALKNVKIKNVSQVPKTKLELERFVYFFKDSLTGCYNQKYLEFVLSKNNDEFFNYKYIVFIYLHNFGEYNKKYGWKNGDKELARIARELRKVFSSGVVFRKEGDDFVVLCKNKISIDEKKLKNIVNDTIITISYEQKELDENLREKLIEELI
ncbi:conserved hypothetical protein [Lebetimonas natsushimae]|uniref:Two-component system response regulator n=1 Tax=Lebetimonas natsushimae TaxID=1936991 RepID=A0A292YDR5_9BACT|nr:HD domain-containing phosphohydrolase [Lebetimonas natsushimae]GAX87511.1 conserved hypothetical protein [Lebetimonas natsushimae]